MSEEVIEQAKIFVQEQLANEGSGHDWFHIERVWKNAKAIYQEEEVGNPFVIELAALLHDLVDDKLFDAEEGRQRVEYFLDGEGVSQNVTQQVLEIIHTISFSKQGTAVLSTEGEIVQDADRLDAIGAVGIARAFTYGGSVGQPIFNPAVSVREEMSKEEYRNGETSTIHHFYEKLLKVKDLMNTETAIQMAEQRQVFMEEFLIQFFEEIK